MRKLLVLVLALPLLAGARQSENITTREAKDHIGQVETVCGKVVNTHYAAQSKGQPTFLNLDEPYPHEIFTIVIWGSDRSRFGAPESKYQDTRVCVAGKITSYRGTPEIAATDPSQIETSAKTGQPASSSSAAPPPGATAQCVDGTYSYSQNRRGTCSHHGGVSRWLAP